MLRNNGKIKPSVFEFIRSFSAEGKLMTLLILLLMVAIIVRILVVI